MNRKLTIKKAGFFILIMLLCVVGYGRQQAKAADGTIPNDPHPASELNQRISPIMGTRHHNQPTVVNGYLFLAGNAIHEIWDVSDPYNPVLMSEMFSPDRFGEAESHQVSFARYPDGSGFKFYAATTSGKGIDLWDITNVSAPFLAGNIALQGVNYGDNTEAVWGIHWQGDYIYVGGTNTGLHIVDAADPTNPTLVNRIPNSAFGGMSAGPVFAVGNVLIITTPKNSSAIATMDISDPGNPVLLDFENPPNNSYIGGYMGGKAFLQSPFRTYDIMSDPGNITLIGSDTTPSSEYMSFDNGLLYLGSLRTSAGGVGGVLKYDISDPNNIVQLAHIEGRNDAGTDDQFSVPIGNLLVVSDDENLFGSWIAVHETAVDTSAPQVLNVNPADGATDVAETSRVALSFSDQIELASVDQNSFIVRPVGGQPLSGKWGYEHTIVTFWPDQPLQANTTYEVVVPTNGITDLVGNDLTSQFSSTFSTGGTVTPGICDIAPTTPVQIGQTASFSANNADPGSYTYSWEFGDGNQGSGASAAHSYSSVGRYPVILTVTDSGGGGSTEQHHEAENATLSGGVVIANDHAGYFGSGFVDYPGSTGTNVETSWAVNMSQAGSHDMRFRYANGGGGTRSLRLLVNGSAVQVINFSTTGAWTSWGDITIPDVALNSGNNTIELRADAGTVGPNIDRLTVVMPAGAGETSCAATQIVHRPLTNNDPTRSSSVLVDESGGRVWTVNPDSNTVTAVNMSNLTKAFEASVGIRPTSIAQAPNGDVWVVNQGSATISILNDANGNNLGTINLPYGSRPFGLAFAPDGGAAYVTLEALGRLLEINPSSQTVVDSVDLGPDGSGIVPKVRGVAVSADANRVLVTRFVSAAGGGTIYDINAANLAVQGTISLGNSTLPDTPDSGRGIPNYLNAISISPDGVKAWIPSKQDNMDRGQFRDGQALTQDSTVRPIVSQIDLASDQEDLSARMDLNDADFPFATAVSQYGDLVFVAIQGTNNIDVRDAYSGETVAGFSTGLAPQGLELDSNGRLYVQNFLSRSMSVFDVSTILDGSDNTAQNLGTISLVNNELLASQVLQGKQIFYNANDRRMNLEGYLSCASCHLDGGQDGRVWDFTDRGEGFRNTATLRGRGGTAQGPVHWTGNFDEIHDFENDIRNAFGGTGFMSAADFNATANPLGAPKAGLSPELDALAAYVGSLSAVPPSPYRQSDGQLTAQGEAGKAIFDSLNCSSCHSGAQMTDSALNVFHDVGTIQPHSGQRIGSTLTGFDTPTLKGVWFTAPYLHDGSAGTLYDVINNPSHGNASGLSQSDKDDLVAYLLQLDDTASLPPGGTTRLEAEDATLSGGVLVDNLHAGYSGTGFADYPQTTGSNVKVSWTFVVEQSGEYRLDFGYANGGGSARPLTLVINGSTVQSLNFGPTGDWPIWGTESVVDFNLSAGSNTVELVADSNLGPNVDYLDVTQTGGGPQPETSEHEAEDGTLSGGTAVAANHPGYSGTGFVDYPGGTGPNVKVSWQVTPNVGGLYNLTFRYANGSSSTPNRPLTLVVNGITIQSVDFTANGSWTTWQTVTVSGVTLNNGANTIEMVADTILGPNLDKMTVAP